MHGAARWKAVRIRVPNGFWYTETLPIGTRLGERERTWRECAKEGEASFESDVGGETDVSKVFRVSTMATILCRVTGETGSNTLSRGGHKQVKSSNPDLLLA